MSSYILQVFQRERLNGHYGVMAFVIANTLSSLPFLLAIATVTATITYFMAGLHPGFSHYIFFVVGLFGCVTVVESLMMAVASVVPNFLMGIVTGAGIMVCSLGYLLWLLCIFSCEANLVASTSPDVSHYLFSDVQGVFMLVAGFFRLPNDLPKIIWRYPMSYLSFNYWALRVHISLIGRGLVNWWLNFCDYLQCNEIDIINATQMLKHIPKSSVDNCLCWSI